MTTVLQLSDTHLAAGSAPVSGRLATDAPLEHLINRLCNSRAQWGEIDAVLVTGDISDDGSDDSYARFKETLSPLNLPVFVIPGNHDAREAMRQAFLADGYLPDAGPLNWHRRVGDICIIGVDTLVEGKGHGQLTADTLHFLESQLQAAQGLPVMLALHHPPFHTGIAFMDAIGLNNAGELADILAATHSTVRVVCGHIHSMMVAEVAGQVVVSSPSPCSNFELDLRATAPTGYYDRDDGCLLHRWSNGFQTVRIGPVAGTGPHPFN